MEKYLSFDGKTFPDLLEKVKYEDEITSAYDYYLITRSEKTGKAEDGGSYVFSCPGVAMVKKVFGKDGVVELRIFLRGKYGDEYIDEDANIRAWMYTKVNILDPDYIEFVARYGIILRVDSIVNVKKR